MNPDPDPDRALLAWLRARLDRCLPMDQWQHDALSSLIHNLNPEPRYLNPES